MTYVHFLGLKLYFLKKDRSFCCLFVTDGICSEVLRKRCLPRNDGVKIQQHMRFSRGVSHAILAKSQTGCKIRSISSSSVQISGVMQKRKNSCGVLRFAGAGQLLVSCQKSMKRFVSRTHQFQCGVSCGLLTGCTDTWTLALHVFYPRRKTHWMM